MNLIKELQDDYENGRFEITGENKARFPARGITVKGEYFDRINGGEWNRTSNLITNQGIQYILNTAFGSNQKPSSFHLALFSGSAQPQADWTAASFASNASEITSESEGYEGSERPVWTPQNTQSTTINNLQSVARLTMRTSGSLTVTGVALLTHQQKGGSGGELISATRYTSARTFQNGDIYEIGYNITLTP